MPTYEYLCSKGHKFDRYLKLAEYKTPQVCECGSEAKKLLSTPMIAPMFEDYQSPIDGSAITSKKKRTEDLARSGCVPYEEGMAEESTKRLKDQEYKLEKAMDRTVDEVIEKMPTEKKERLEQELRSGADINYHRL